MNMPAWLPITLDAQFIHLTAMLGLALLLSSLIGLERELKLKDAGLRTHALVGVAAALIMIVSKYGFGDVLATNEVILDPSRVAAQIVSGIGFIGGGLIFVHRDVVRGLTTAAIIWMTAAVGMACGAGLPGLAILVTGAHFVVVSGYTPLMRRILSEQSELQVRYVPGGGTVQEVSETCTGLGFKIQHIGTERADAEDAPGQRTVHIRLRGRRKLDSLVVAISDVRGVEKVRIVPLPGNRD